MKYFSVLLSVTSLIFIEVYGIVPKYVPKAAILSRQSSVEDTRPSDENNSFKKTQKLIINLPLEDDRRKNRLPEVNLKEMINSAEGPNDESVEDFVDLSFEETAGSAEKDAKISKDIYANIQHQSDNEVPGVKSINAGEIWPQEENIVSDYSSISNKRVKRFPAAAYDGRYKSQDINDIFNTDRVNEFQSQNKKVEKDSIKRNDDNTKSTWKRSSNIIEEENLATSIFKFTGRPSMLNEDLAFKNIHT